MAKRTIKDMVLAIEQSCLCCFHTKWWVYYPCLSASPSQPATGILPDHSVTLPYLWTQVQITETNRPTKLVVFFFMRLLHTKMCHFLIGRSYFASNISWNLHTHTHTAQCTHPHVLRNFLLDFYTQGKPYQSLWESLYISKELTNCKVPAKTVSPIGALSSTVMGILFLCNLSMSLCLNSWDWSTVQEIK